MAEARFLKSEYTPEEWYTVNPPGRSEMYMKGMRNDVCRRRRTIIPPRIMLKIRTLRQKFYINIVYRKSYDNYRLGRFYDPVYNPLSTQKDYCFRHPRETKWRTFKYNVSQFFKAFETEFLVRYRFDNSFWLYYESTSYKYNKYDTRYLNDQQIEE